MTSEVDMSLKLILFTGKSIWSMWNAKFMCRAQPEQYRTVLLGTANVPKFEEFNELDSARKAKLKLRT
jgi:hypothetical protein